MSGIINSAGSKSGIIGTTELDYEKGTWTPIASGGTWSVSGEYIKIGSQVTIWMQAVCSVVGDGSILSFTGVPFTPNSTFTQVPGSLMLTGGGGHGPTFPTAISGPVIPIALLSNTPNIAPAVNDNNAHAHNFLNNAFDPTRSETAVMVVTFYV